MSAAERKAFKAGDRIVTIIDSVEMRQSEAGIDRGEGFLAGQRATIIARSPAMLDVLFDGKTERVLVWLDEVRLLNVVELAGEL